MIAFSDFTCISIYYTFIPKTIDLPRLDRESIGIFNPEVNEVSCSVLERGKISPRNNVSRTLGVMIICLSPLIQKSFGTSGVIGDN
jgi:hypothetical protein